MKKRGFCINDVQDNTSGDDAAEKWSTPINWEKDPPSRQNGEEKIHNKNYFEQYCTVVCNTNKLVLTVKIKNLYIVNYTYSKLRDRKLRKDFCV